MSQSNHEQEITFQECFEVAQYRLDDFLVLLKRAKFTTLSGQPLDEFQVDVQLVDLFDDEEWEELSAISKTIVSDLEKAFHDFIFETFANITLISKDPNIYRIQVLDEE